MKKFLMGLMAFVFSVPAMALDGVYLGGQVGFVGLTGDASKVFDNAIGFGADVGFRANPILDLVGSFQHSSHDKFGGLNLNSAFLSADFHVLNVNDIELTLSGGP